MQYCPPVPFRPELMYCYPPVNLQLADMVALAIFGIAIVISLTLYMKGKAK